VDPVDQVINVSLKLFGRIINAQVDRIGAAAVVVQVV
jgi:hypothetical protein